MLESNKNKTVYVMPGKYIDSDIENNVNDP